MYERELEVACRAVERASILTQQVYQDQAKGITNKEDQSPVTVGDYGAQALVIHAVKKAFPDDDIVGEEDATGLRKDAALVQRIWALVEATADEDALSSAEAMLAAIDAGNSCGGPRGRFWALDPIDGTKGFIRGGQYAVCLALVVDGQVAVGVLACPNLTQGTVFHAVAGQGSFHYSPSTPRQVSVMRQNIVVQDAVFCESVEAAHSSQDDHAAVARELGIRSNSVRMDSQAKYGCVSRGDGDIYLRLPVRAGYEEKIWDHAAGDLIVREAGGTVTDIDGKRLDFSQGRTLKNNRGIVAAPAALHAEVLSAVRLVLCR